MAYDPNNVFARILRGELPCEKLYEDAATIAIMDIMPQADGHALVVTRESAVTLMDVSPEGAAACIRTTQRIARAVMTGMGVPGVMVMQFNGTAAGQSVPHLHLHVVPRSTGAALRTHAREMAAPETIRAHADLIRRALAQLPS
jgi:histidine triad (HIT) family protein